MQARTLQARGGLTALWCASAAAIATLITCTITGNTAVLLALRRTRRAPAHYPLASLAAADLLVGLFILPIAATRELFVLQIHWLICTCWETLDVFCCTASILSLCALGWERWCGITAPLARAKRAKRSKLLAGLVWPVAMVVALPSAFVYTPIHHRGEIEMACPDNKNVSYVFVSSMLSFYLPAVVMLVLYARILRALSVPPNIRAHKGKPPCHHNSQIEKPAANATSRCSTPLSNKNTTGPQKNPVHIVTRQRCATRTIVRLMALFLACWTPFFVILPTDSLCDCVWDPIWQWCTWLGYTNSVLNPLVYAAATPSVRRALHASLSSSARTTEMQMTPNKRF